MQTDRSISPVFYVSLISFVLISLVLAFGDTFRAMVGIWFASASFNHCLLVPLATALLIWRQRHHLAGIQPNASVLGLCAFFAAAGVWMLGYLGNILTLQSFALVGMITTSFWAVLGWPLFRAMAFPLGYLFFMVPFGEFLVPMLMESTADIAVFALRASGVPIYRDGLFLEIPNGSFRIIEACSGLRMLIASLAISVLFAHFTFKSRIRWVTFIAAMIVASLLANALRAYLVVITGHFLGMDAINGHQTLGYVVFGAVIVGMLLVGSRFADVEASYASPFIDYGAQVDRGPVWASAVAAVTIIAVSFSLPGGASTISVAARHEVTSIAPQLPEGVGQWHGPRPGYYRHNLEWSPLYLGYDATRFGQYSSPAGVIDAYLIWYRSQDQGAELINSRNMIFNPVDWTRVHVRSGDTKLRDGRSLEYIETELLSRRGGKRLVRHWYVVGGDPLHRPWQIKLRELFNALRGHSTPASLVIISAIFDNDSRPAREMLDAFMSDVYVLAQEPPLSEIGDSP